MKEFSLDPDVIAFIDSHLEVSNLSTATAIDQRRIDYEAIVRHFRYPNSPDLQHHQKTRQPLASTNLKPSTLRTESQGFGAVTGILFQKRREYIHVGSRATSLLRNVLKKHPGAHGK